MVVVGRLVGTFEPALVMVAIAQANSASASTNTIPPIQPAGAEAGMNGNDTTHCRVSPTSTASAHAIGGRTMILAVSAVSLMAEPVKPCARFDVCLLKTPLNPCGTMLGHGSDSELSENTRLRAVIVRSTIRSVRPSQRMSKFDRLMSIAVETERIPNRGNFPLKSKVKNFDGLTVGFRPSERYFATAPRTDSADHRGFCWRRRSGHAKVS